MLTRALRDQRVLPLVIGTVIAVAIVCTLVGALVGYWWLGVVVGVFAGGALALLAARRGAGAVLTSLPTGNASVEALARMTNLLDGLGASAGQDMPTLALVDSDAMNCCLVVGPEQATLAITRGLAEQMGRMELEAVLARELALLRDGEAEVGTVLAGFASLLPGSLSDRVSARMGDATRVVVADLTGARLTRYPPGLVSALTILSTAQTAVPGAKRCSAHLWLAQPFGSGTPETDVTHPPIETRIDTLREL